MREIERRPRRLLILPVEVAGYGSRVAEGFRELGWSVDTLDLSGNPLGYPQAPAADPHVAALNETFAQARASTRWRGCWQRAWSLPLALRTAWVAVPSYDAVIYLYGRSLVGRLDAWRLRRARRRSVAVFLGTDARPPYLSGHWTNTGRPVPVVRTLLRTLLAFSRVRKMEKWADSVICHPAYGHFFRGPFVNWLAVGMPAPALVSTAEESPQAPYEHTLLLHAPSSRHKGTQEIRTAVDVLQQRGLAIELELLSGRANSEVLEAIARSDVVIDELYSDTPLAGFASEAAAAGRPVLTFGYASRIARTYSGMLGTPSSHFLEPEDLVPAIERLVLDPPWRQALVNEAHEFIERESQPVMVARKIERLIDGDTPAEWLVDPSDVDYCEGWGAPREVTRAAVNRYIGRLGVTALMLPKSGAARAAILEFAGRDYKGRRRREGPTPR